MGPGVVEYCSSNFRSISYSNGLYKTKHFCFGVNNWVIGTLEMYSSETQKIRRFFLCGTPSYFSTIGSRCFKVVRKTCVRLIVAMM